MDTKVVSLEKENKQAGKALKRVEKYHEWAQVSLNDDKKSVEDEKKLKEDQATTLTIVEGKRDMILDCIRVLNGKLEKATRNMPIWKFMCIYYDKYIAFLYRNLTFAIAENDKEGKVTHFHTKC